MIRVSTALECTVSTVSIVNGVCHNGSRGDQAAHIAAAAALKGQATEGRLLDASRA
jgi:hypothetical protein